MQSPRALLDGRIEKAVPMFSALLGRPENLVLIGVSLVETFGDQFPVSFLITPDGFAEQFRLQLGPLVGNQLHFL